VIDYSIDASFRGRGLGVPLMQAAMARFAGDVGDVPLLASVKADNQASLKVFTSLGFISVTPDGASAVQQFRHGYG
jgi:L-amino acid N-acyltransferase YncA